MTQAEGVHVTAQHSTLQGDWRVEKTCIRVSDNRGALSTRLSTTAERERVVLVTWVISLVLVLHGGDGPGECTAALHNCLLRCTAR